MNDPVKDLLKMAKDKVKEMPEKYPKNLPDRINVLTALIRDFKSNFVPQGKRIKALRENKGMTLGQLGDMVGITRERVRQHEANMFVVDHKSQKTHSELLKFVSIYSTSKVK